MDDKILSIDVYGDCACFTQSDAKVERVSYPVITPSAARNILNSIYCKPIEFYYEIVGIDVMRPIRYQNIRQNEIYKKANKKNLLEPICTNDIHTQRGTRFLWDVYYRLYFIIHFRKELNDPHVTEDGIHKQFMRRLKKGKCFHQPYLGLKECMAFFEEPNPDMEPIPDSMDLGIMLYDIFDITNNIPLNTDKNMPTCKTDMTFFHPYMINGHIEVPRWKSQEIFRYDPKNEV